MVKIQPAERGSFRLRLVAGVFAPLSRLPRRLNPAGPGPLLMKARRYGKTPNTKR